MATLFVAGCAGSNGMIVANATTQDQKCLAEAIYFEAGYITLKDWWRIGGILSVMNITIWIFSGFIWWKFIGLW